MNSLYTIGHSNNSFEYFQSLLNKYGIEYLIDVRSYPYSKFYTHFNRINLKNKLKTKYVFLGNSLGGKPKDRKFYINNIIDYSIIQKEQNFIDKVKLIVENSKNTKICLMCSEADPFKCHRNRLISEYIRSKYNHIDINHILKNGKLENHKETVNKMIDSLFTNI